MKLMAIGINKGFESVTDSVMSFSIVARTCIAMESLLVMT